MNIILFPEDSDSGPIRKLFKKLEQTDRPLWTLVREYLEKVKRSSNLNDLEKQEIVKPVKYTKVPLYEFRIPKTRRKGVVRLYFAYKKSDRNTIIILAAEKKNKKAADSIKIAQAEQRYKEVCDNE